MSEQSEEKRAAVHFLTEQGLSVSQIRRKLKCGASFVQRWKNQKNSYHDRPRSGRGHKVTQLLQSSLIGAAAFKRHRSTRKVAAQFSARSSVSISHMTVHRILTQAALRAYHRPRKPTLSEEHQRKRLAWAKENKNLQSANIVVVDEKHWKPFAPGNRKNDVVWAYSPEQVPVLEAQSQGPEFHTVGAMSRHGVFPLVFYEGSMNAAKYQEILDRHILPAAQEVFGDQGYVLLHDLSTSHTSKSTRKFLQEALPESCSFKEFPPHSPDIDLVDTLWAQVLWRVQGRKWRTMRGYKTIIDEEWNNVKNETCEKLCDGLKERLAAIRKARGAHTVY